MIRIGFIWLIFAWGCAAMDAQQVLLVNPGGIVVIEKNNAISMMEKSLSPDEMTFEHNGMVYPNGGSAYFSMMENNAIKFDVIKKIMIKDKKIYFEGSLIDVGARVYQVDKALRWGGLIACLGVVPNKPKHWLEPKKAYALIIFSPNTGRGSCKELYLTSGKASCDMWLLDSIQKGR